ncbi:peptidylprolyl isomerase [Mesoterricola silvestris]|uniref:Periplasmic chaperone PpiD n=1 Tax=Mesoterricola silvestris TaxID=2927979 RepID=A0AA48GUP8_9BACT|nr:peptidyl-prolyl cis-trans isomerase [Mesoterricola silvestris]BDU74402.1 peptidylprolyl isomerase [Mesoterricola silvestris]
MLRNFRQVFKGNQTPMAVVMMVVLLGLVAYLAPSGASSAAPDNVLARVYGRDVLKRDVDSMIAQYVKRMGKQANIESLMPMLQQQALDGLISNQLRLELAERHDIVVTDAEVRAALEARLRSIPLFLDEKGQLRESGEINSVLRENGTSLKQWETELASELSLRKLVGQAASRVPVDQAWVELENRVRNEKISFEAVTASPDPSGIPDPGDAKLQAFLKDSGARFQEGPRRVISYVSVDEASLGLAPVDDAKVKALYEARKAQYTELKASHILFKAESEAQLGEAFKKAGELRAKLVAGQDFAKAAEAFSEDPSAKGKGGDLGWFAPGQMVKPFTDAAAALKIGDISQPVKTQFGVHLIRLEGRREKPFEAVKEELRAQIARDTFAAKAKDKLEQLRKRAGERGDLAAPARNLGLKVATSKPFTAGDAAGLEGLPGSQGLTGEAFRLEVGQVSKVRMAGASYAVFRVQEELPVAVPPLADIKAKVLTAWKLEEARTALRAKADQAAGDLKALGTPETKDGVTIQSLAELGQHPAIRKALLETPAGKATPPCWTPDGKIWVARIKERTPAAPLTFETRRTLVEALQTGVAEKLLTAELMTLAEEGRKRPGFSSLYGRFGGIWRNEEALKRMGSDVPDAPDFE